MHRLTYFLTAIIAIFLISCSYQKMPTEITEIPEKTVSSNLKANVPAIFWWKINQFRLATILEHYDINHGKWSIQNNALLQSDSNSPPDHRAIYRYFEEDYFIFSADLTVTNDDGANYAIGLIFRAKDLMNYYYIYLGQSGEIATAKVINGSWQLLYSRYFEPLPIDKTTRIRIEVQPGKLSVFRDDVLKYTISLEITEFSTGKVGFTCSWGASAKFENVEIQVF